MIHAEEQGQMPLSQDKGGDFNDKNPESDLKADKSR